MPQLIVLRQDQARELLDLDALFDALTQAMRSLSDGTASVPGRVAAFSPDGMLGAMPGFVPGLGLGAKLVAYFRGNDVRGLPSHQALIALFDVETGTPLAVMDGTYITATRTATTAAVAAQALARPASATLTIIGAGVQGHAHLDAFTRVFSFREIRIVSRTKQHAEALAARNELAHTGESFAEAVAGADVVCLCSDADEPVIARSWLGPGVHVSSVGVGVEIDAETIEAASVFVESRSAATQPFPAGSRELAGIDPESVTEIGEVLLGVKPGRRTPDELTVYKSMGHAVEDIAAASLVYRAAIKHGIGARVEI